MADDGIDPIGQVVDASLAVAHSRNVASIGSVRAGVDGHDARFWPASIGICSRLGVAVEARAVVKGGCGDAVCVIARAHIPIVALHRAAGGHALRGRVGRIIMIRRIASCERRVVRLLLVLLWMA